MARSPSYIARNLEDAGELFCRDTDPDAVRLVTSSLQPPGETVADLLGSFLPNIPTPTAPDWQSRETNSSAVRLCMNLGLSHRRSGAITAVHALPAALERLEASLGAIPLFKRLRYTVLLGKLSEGRWMRVRVQGPDDIPQVAVQLSGRRPEWFHLVRSFGSIDLLSLHQETTRYEPTTDPDALETARELATLYKQLRVQSADLPKVSKAGVKKFRLDEVTEFRAPESSRGLTYQFVRSLGGHDFDQPARPHSQNLRADVSFSFDPSRALDPANWEPLETVLEHLNSASSVPGHPEVLAELQTVFPRPVTEIRRTFNLLPLNAEVKGVKRFSTDRFGRLLPKPVSGSVLALRDGQKAELTALVSKALAMPGASSGAPPPEVFVQLGRVSLPALNDPNGTFHGSGSDAAPSVLGLGAPIETVAFDEFVAVVDGVSLTGIRCKGDGVAPIIVAQKPGRLSRVVLERPGELSLMVEIRSSGDVLSPAKRESLAQDLVAGTGPWSRKGSGTLSRYDDLMVRVTNKSVMCLKPTPSMELALRGCVEKPASELPAFLEGLIARLNAAAPTSEGGKAKNKPSPKASDHSSAKTGTPPVASPTAAKAPPKAHREAQTGAVAAGGPPNPAVLALLADAMAGDEKDIAFDDFVKQISAKGLSALSKATVESLHYRHRASDLSEALQLPSAAKQRLTDYSYGAEGDTPLMFHRRHVVALQLPCEDLWAVEIDIRERKELQQSMNAVPDGANLYCLAHYRCTADQLAGALSTQRAVVDETNALVLLERPNPRPTRSWGVPLLAKDSEGPFFTAEGRRVHLYRHASVGTGATTPVTHVPSRSALRTFDAGSPLFRMSQLAAFVPHRLGAAEGARFQPLLTMESWLRQIGNGKALLRKL